MKQSMDRVVLVSLTSPSALLLSAQLLCPHPKSHPASAGTEWAELGGAETARLFSSSTPATLSLDTGNSIKTEGADLYLQ